jgi:hypothetical protein
MAREYDFTYKDNEGDLYSSPIFSTQKEADAYIRELYQRYDGDCEIVEDWIYDVGEKESKFIGRWR